MTKTHDAIVTPGHNELTQYPHGDMFSACMSKDFCLKVEVTETNFLHSLIFYFFQNKQNTGSIEYLIFEYIDILQVLLHLSWGNTSNMTLIQRI